MEQRKDMVSVKVEGRTYEVERGAREFVSPEGRRFRLVWGETMPETFIKAELIPARPQIGEPQHRLVWSGELTYEGTSPETPEHFFAEVVIGIEHGDLHVLRRRGFECREIDPSMISGESWLRALGALAARGSSR